MELLARIKDRSPEYDTQYYQLILDFTIEQGGASGTKTEEVKYTQGKYFSTRYEIYMYAALLGLKKDYQIPIERGTDKTKFIPIKSWQPSEVADYIIMALLGKSELDFNELENMEEKEVEDKITELRSLLEAYANGGFDIIRAKREEHSNFFMVNENCFLDLLG
jgi:hypothetical protein